jgi:hypothetical protein
MTVPLWMSMKIWLYGHVRVHAVNQMAKVP